MDGCFHRRAAQLRKVRARRGRQDRRGVQLGRIAEHQSCAAQRIVVAMGFGLIMGGGMMVMPGHLMIRDVRRVRSALRVFMARRPNRLGAHLHGPARDEDQRGQDMGQRGGEPLNHDRNIARSECEENHLRPDVALACGYPLAKCVRLRYAQP